MTALILLCFILTSALAHVDGNYKVIRIIDGDTFVIDFNKDGIEQQNEKVRANGINGFETRSGKSLEKQIEYFGISKEQTLKLGKLGKKFAEENLLNKYVEVKYTAKTQMDSFGRQLVSIYYNNGKNYEIEILKTGLAFVYSKSNIAADLTKYENRAKILANLGVTESEPRYILNLKNGKYHKQGCEYGEKASEKKMIKASEVGDYKAAGCCFTQKPVLDTKAPPQEIKYDEGHIKLIFTDPLRYERPQVGCVNEVCASLLSLINNSKKSINFAIYGLSGQPEILDALKKAQARGIIVRGITDMDVYGVNIYKDTERLIGILETVKTDYHEDLRTRAKQIEKNQARGNGDFDIRSDIMHDKFFVVDNTYLWAGSTNVTENCMSYNANNAVIIKSEKIADLYNREFAQMYDYDKFHKSKGKISDNENIILSDGTKVSVYFSPQDKPISTSIIPLINKAEKYIDVPIFYLTHKDIIASLLQAHTRGVEVRIIIDANSAANKFSKHHELRNNGVKVKTENWGGKMHMKSAIIDDKYVVIASMNWTVSAENANDENTLVIENEKLAKIFRQEFNRLWNSIPDKWLTTDPRAESLDSIGSCFDGIDNNHNGYTDLDDFGCRPFKDDNKDKLPRQTLRKIYQPGAFLQALFLRAFQHVQTVLLQYFQAA